ncbi:MAG: hypothetical protein K9N35_07015 [Candidatus Marinimicrobia bacterium]|nr:hypothetical protein [Candidatus Neomarinimicrobiota bacterium]
MKTLRILVLLPCLIWAQPEFFGYFESEADVMQLGSNRYSYGYNKLRLDVEARPNDHVLIGANISAQKYWGKTNWNVFDFIPGYESSGMTMSFDLPDTLLLDNMYMKLSFPILDLTLGRQQISPGVGYAWNPTDIYNTKSLMDPSYEQTGVNAIRALLQLGDRSSFNAIISTDENPGNTIKQLQLKSGIGRFDVSLSAAKFGWKTARAYAYNYDELDQRTLLGGSIVGEIAGLGLWGEFGYNEVDYVDDPIFWAASFVYPGQMPDSFSEYLIGVDHTFDNSLYTLCEYFHNGYGVAKKNEVFLSDYLYTLAGESHSLMQDYGFLYLMHPTFDYVSLSTLAIANFNDKSGTIAPQLDWNAFEDTDISVQVSWSWGTDDTEFGIQDWGLRLRLRSNF